MDANQLLKNTLSPDSTTRTSAEQQLSSAAEADFPGYLRTLAQELANEQADQDVRMAAGLALKNSFSAREYVRLRQVQLRWFEQIDPEVKNFVKSMALKTLASNDLRAGMQAAQFIASIAAIEIPIGEWPDLLPLLVRNVSEGQDHQKQASLGTIGYICEIQDNGLRQSLAQYSNTILTAVVQGARKEESNEDVRLSAMTALGDSLEFVRSNFENEGERNFIMQVVCEATQSRDSRVMQAAYGCLNRIMALYYDKMYYYMEKALFGLTIQGMKHEDEDVAKLAVEFWCSVCEEEINIEDDNANAEVDGVGQRQHFNFARIATQEVIPVLLELLTKQDEDASDEEYNVHRAAYQCLSLWSQVVGNGLVQSVLQFVESNIRSDDWHSRDAAVSAFGAIMEGPDEETLDNIVKQGLPVLIGMMQDQSIHVKDSAAYTLGRICDCVSEAIDPSVHLQPLVESLFTGLTSNPKMASSCCWALISLSERFSGDPGAQENALSPHYDGCITALVQTTERIDSDNSVRTAAYEVLSSFVMNAAMSNRPTVASLSNVILDRLEQSLALRQQVLSVEDKLKLEELQTSLSSVTTSIITTLQAEIAPQADRIMHVLLQILNTLSSKSSVADSVLAAIGGLASALEEDFLKYMDPFFPYLMNALNNKEEPALCAMAIGLVGDITRALGAKAQPYCNEFMNSLLENLRSTSLGNQFKPSILQCFGDIAQAIGGAFEMYLEVVAQVLDQASSLNIDTSLSFEILDYVVSLREGVMDAWSGAIIAMKADNKSERLKPYVESIFRLLRSVADDQNKSEALLRSAMGVIGDLADAFPKHELSNLYRQEWLAALIKETKQGQDFDRRTIDTAKWAREQAKLQGGTEFDFFYVAHHVSKTA